MLLDMDSELQHLISISMDKMTSGAGASTAGHGGRKSRGMDLRKALLVAHFLQEVRCAYFDEDYEIVANTISDIKSTHYDKEMEISEYDEDTVKDIDERYSEESRTYLMETDSKSTSPPSSSALPSCVTNSDVMVSRISQVTRPLSVSINTNHVMSCQSSVDLCAVTDGCSDTCSEDEDVPVVCEELEVSSCCEVISSNEDEPMSRDAEAEAHECLSAVNRMKSLTGSDARADEGALTLPSDSAHIPAADINKCDSTADRACTTRPGSHTRKTISSTTCPLPKKKRPLPKEFLDDDQQSSSPVYKTARTDLYKPVETSRVPTGQFVTNTFATSIAHTVTLESRTSTSLSTVCSVIGTSPFFSSQFPAKYQPSPKVVVQLTQSCDSYLPITCTQMCLEQRLSELTARTFQHAAA